MAQPRNRRRERLKSIVVVACALAGVVVLIVVLGRLDKTEKPAETETVRVGPGPVTIAAGPNAIWVAHADSSLRSIDPDDLSVSPKITNLGERPGDLLVVDSTLWVGSIEGTSILRIGSTGDAIGEPIEIGDTPKSLAFGGGSVWAAAFNEPTIAEIDPSTGEVVDTFTTKAKFPAAIIWAGDSLWIADVVKEAVVRYTPSTGEQQLIEVGDAPTAIAGTEEALFVANFNDESITKIDVESGTVDGDAVTIGGKPGGIYSADGFVWITRAEDDFLFRLDPETMAPIGVPVSVGDNPQGVTFGHGAAWVANQGSNSVTRVEF